MTDGPEAYDGSWVADKMCGEGIMTFASGDIYEGAFKDDSFCGIGKYKWNDGAIYEGQWMNSRYLCSRIISFIFSILPILSFIFQLCW